MAKKKGSGAKSGYVGNGMGTIKAPSGNGGGTESVKIIIPSGGK